MRNDESIELLCSLNDVAREVKSRCAFIIVKEFLSQCASTAHRLQKSLLPRIYARRFLLLREIQHAELSSHRVGVYGRPFFLYS
jgi:hypothetical protein